MDLPLFVYGTLRDVDMLSGVLGRPLRPGELHAAVAPGYRAVHYPGRVYPALVRTPGAAAPGLIVLGLSRFEHDLLDAFEGEEYRRGAMAAMVGEELFEAEAYLPAISIAPDAAQWTLELWQAQHKARVLEGERVLAHELRQKLIAIRPN